MLRISSWPQRPFFRAATQLGLASVQQTYISEFEKVRESLRQIETLNDPEGVLRTKLEGLAALMKQRGLQGQEFENQLEAQIEHIKEETGILALKNLTPLQRLEHTPRVKRVMDLLRRYIPKYFFKCVNRQLSFNQGQRLMIAFRSRVEEGIIVPEASLADYLRTLYTDNQLALGRPIRTESR